MGRQGLPQGQKQAASVQGDSGHVKDVAEALLKERVIGGGPVSNRWNLHKDPVHSSTKVEGDQVTVTFDVGYGLNPFERYRSTVSFTFQGKNTGGIKEYDLAGAGLDHWDGLGVVKGQFEGVAKELFRAGVGKIVCQRFDENAFAANAVRQAEGLYGAWVGTFTKNFVERIDGGFKVLIYTDNREFNPLLWSRSGGLGEHENMRGRGELWLTFKYDDAQLAQGFVKVSEIRQGFHYRDQIYSNSIDSHQKWHDTGSFYHGRVRDANWRLTDTDRAPLPALEQAGNQLGAGALTWFKERGSLNVGGSRLGPMDGQMVALEACSEGVRAVLYLKRDDSRWGTLEIHVALTLKYEGVVNGQHQFKLVGFDHRHPFHGADPGLEGFGINPEEVLKQFPQVRV
jgi:hypothetical protein